MPRQRKRRGNPIDGILILDKPKGMSSNHALQRCKRLYNAQKAGHTGALDPLATGVLPICFGEATKLSQYWLDSDKTYQVVAKLGEVTDTLDADGEILQTADVPELTMARIEEVIASYIGDIEQVPPLYSALKYQGKPLYELAREGKMVDMERKRRVITIYSIDIVDWQSPLLTLKVSCSKGTYIRTLVDDIGKDFTCGAHVLELRRLKAGSFDIEQAIDLESIEGVREEIEHYQDDLKRKLLPIEHATHDWLQVTLSDEQTATMLHGQSVELNSAEPEELVAMFCEVDSVEASADNQLKRRFIGMGQIKADGRLYPRRLVRSPNDA